MRRECNIGEHEKISFDANGVAGTFFRASCHLLLAWPVPFKVYLPIHKLSKVKRRRASKDTPYRLTICVLCLSQLVYIYIYIVVTCVVVM